MHSSKWIRTFEAWQTPETMFSKLHDLLSPKARREVVWIIACFLLTAVFEVVGIAAIFPFIAMGGKPELAEQLFGFVHKCFVSYTGLCVLLALAAESVEVAPKGLGVEAMAPSASGSAACEPRCRPPALPPAARCHWSPRPGPRGKRAGRPGAASRRWSVFHRRGRLEDGLDDGFAGLRVEHRIAYPCPLFCRGIGPFRWGGVVLCELEKTSIVNRSLSLAGPLPVVADALEMLNA